MQTTIARAATFEGVGLHGGAPARMTLRPAAVDSGLRFQRVDVTDRDPIIGARFDNVVDTRLCTRIANEDDVSVGTIEHVMAALSAFGVDNALIEIDGPEVPIMDGSAAPFFVELVRAGLSVLEAPRRALKVLKPVEVVCNGGRAVLEPSDAAALEIDFLIDFPDGAIGRQQTRFSLSRAAFATGYANCRTFARRNEIDALRAAGLARGGDLTNAVVVDGDHVLNPEGLRRPDEFVRHKALDAVGDLALAGGPVLGRYRGEKAGHAVTNQLLRALFASPGAFEWVREPALALSVAAE